VSAKAAAVWMAYKVQREGTLYQRDAADYLEGTHGEAAVYYNDHGNPALTKAVLDEFRALTEATVVWDRREKCWRKRTAQDGSGRLSSD
jgi:hypothetical protein